MTVIIDCQTVDKWNSNLASGSHTYGLDTTDFIYGSASVKATSNPPIWQMFIEWLGDPDRLDLTSEPKLRFAIKPSIIDDTHTIELNVICVEGANSWSSHRYGVIEGLVANQWNTVEVDLRTDQNLLQPDLSQVRAIVFKYGLHIPGGQNDPNAHTLKIGLIESLPADIITCSVDADCGPGLVCINGDCVPHAPCGANETWDDDIKQCIAVQGPIHPEYPPSASSMTIRCLAMMAWSRYYSDYLPSCLDKVRVQVPHANCINLRMYWNVDPNNPNNPRLVPTGENANTRQNNTIEETAYAADQIHQRGLMFWLVINHSYSMVPAPEVAPTDWAIFFENYKNNVMIPVAQLCKDKNIEILSIGMEYMMKNSKLVNPNEHTGFDLNTAWIDIIQTIRSISPNTLITFNGNYWWSPERHNEIMSREWYRSLDFISCDHWSGLITTCEPQTVDHVSYGWTNTSDCWDWRNNRLVGKTEGCGYPCWSGDVCTSPIDGLAVRPVVETSGPASTGKLDFTALNGEHVTNFVDGYRVISEYFGKPININTGCRPYIGSIRTHNTPYRGNIEAPYGSGIICSGLSDHNTPVWYYYGLFKAWLDKSFLNGFLLESYSISAIGYTGTMTVIMDAPCESVVEEGFALGAGEAAPLSLNVSPTHSQITIGQSKNITAMPSGGTPPYTVEWLQKDQVIYTGTTFNFTGTETGTFLFTVRVTDAASQSVETQVSITVSEVSNALPLLTLLVILGIISLS